MKTLIKEIMTTDLKTLQIDDSMGNAKELFLHNDFHHIPITDKEDKLKGIISKGDYYKLLDHFTVFNSISSVSINNKFLYALLVQEVMAKSVETITPDSTILKAGELFVKNEYHALPVVKDGKLVGLITTTDIINHYVTAEKEGEISTCTLNPPF